MKAPGVQTNGRGRARHGETTSASGRTTRIISPRPAPRGRNPHEPAQPGHRAPATPAERRPQHPGTFTPTRRPKGTRDVALTRGTTTNTAYVFTRSPKRADPAPGPRPAPELARYDKIHTERAAVPAPPAPSDQALSALAGAWRSPPNTPATVTSPSVRVVLATAQEAL